MTKHAIRKSLRTNLSPDLRTRLHRGRMKAMELGNLPGWLAGRRPQRPVFVVGAPRSGTSILYSVLSRSSGLVRRPPGEFHEIWEADYHPAFRDWSSNVLAASDLTPAAARRIQRRFYMLAGDGRLLDKTPRNALRIGFVDAIFEDASYIFIQRDGRENVNSLINAWRSPRYRTYRLPVPHSIPGCDPNWWKFVLYEGWKDDTSGPVEVVAAKQWVACNEHLLEHLPARGERVMTIRYEDLIERPVDEVGRLMDFLGLEYEDAVRTRAAAVNDTPVNIVTPPERGKWRKENPDEIAAIEELLEPTLKAIGYDV